MPYPGGSTVDIFHWQSNSVELGNTEAGPITFERFMQVMCQVGATPIIAANYGSGTFQEAAAWVRYTNVTHHYDIKFWEIGNEVYSNGTYGAAWEYDTRAPKRSGGLYHQCIAIYTCHEDG